MTKPKIIFRTIHGSRLYGLDHAGSDYDWYTVIVREPIRNIYTQKSGVSTHDVIDSQDSNVKDLQTWLNECAAGVPQALEAMFSSVPEIDSIPEFRRSFHIGLTSYEYYRRTMRNFAVSPEFKRRRHAVRLALNARDIAAYGRFNPRMHPKLIDAATRIAHNLSGEDLIETVDDLAWGR